MILIVDSGSTKCDWFAIDTDGKQLLEKQRTKGLNPAILSGKKFEMQFEFSPTKNCPDKIKK